MEQLDYQLLFRWFVGLNTDDPVWDPTVFTENRQRLLDGEIATAFLERSSGRPDGVACCRMSTSRWTARCSRPGPGSRASSARTRRRLPDDPGNPIVNFHGERRSNDTHASTTDPEARLARKGAGREAKLSYARHALIDNRHGLVVNAEATAATGTAERAMGLAMARALPEGAAPGADKVSDTQRVRGGPSPPRGNAACGQKHRESAECD